MSARRRSAREWLDLLAQGGARWKEPPEDLVSRALGARREKRLPRTKRRRTVHWDAADVRSPGGPSVADDAKIVAGSCPGGEVSVLVHPPLENATWSFEARIWFAEPDDTARAVIGLVHDDHVLQRHEVADGEMCRFEEIVPDGWSLEIHLPDGDTVVLDDPFHTE